MTGMQYLPAVRMTLRKIADGKLDPILAVTLRKLKVEGNIDKALKLKTLIESHK